MKKSYKFGEMLLYVREEYKENSYLLHELNRCIHVMNHEKFHFEGKLSLDKESIIRLKVEKKYLEILKKIQWLRYDWYSQFLYTAYLNVSQNSTPPYILEETSKEKRIAKDKVFMPSVEIVDQDKFDNLIHKLFSLDIMKIKKSNLFINHDFISLDFGSVLIGSTLGYHSSLYWNSNIDTIDYSVKKDCSPYMLEKILYLEIPIEYIPIEWVQIFEKHENKFSDNLSFHVDINASRKKGNLQIDTSDNRSIKLLRKSL